MMETAKIVLLGGLFAFTLACGGYSSKTSMPQPGVMPVIAQLVPDNTNAGAPAFTLTVNGNSFAATAAINWNGSAQATTYVSANQLTAMIPASDVTTTGTVPVSVTNPGMQGMGSYGAGGTQAETSNVMNFTIN